MFWYKNLATLWCLFCKISSNDTFFIILDCCFICYFDVAESYLLLLGVLFPLNDLGFCLVWIRVGVTWMDRICPHRSWNGRMNGALVSVEAIRILMIVRYIIGGVGEVEGIGWNKSVYETSG